MLTYIKKTLVGYGCLLTLGIILTSCDSSSPQKVDEKSIIIESQSKNEEAERKNADIEEQRKKDFEDWLTPSL